MTLFEVLSFDERVLVLSDPAEQVIYTWNRSATLQAWHKSTAHLATGTWRTSEDKWEFLCEKDIHVLSDLPITYEQARKAAINWNDQ